MYEEYRNGYYHRDVIYWMEGDMKSWEYTKHDCEFIEVGDRCGRPHSEYDQCECPFEDPHKCLEREKDEV